MSASPMELPASITNITYSKTLTFDRNISGKVHCRRIGHVVMVFVIATMFNESVSMNTAWVTIPQEYRPSSSQENVFGQFASTSTGVMVPMTSTYIGSGGTIKQDFTGAISGGRFIGMWVYSV